MKPIDPLKQFEQFELKADFHAPDRVVVEGVTPAYAVQQKELFRRRFNELYGSIVHTIDTLEARRSEHLTVIAELLRQNKSLKDKLKEKTDDINTRGSTQ
jgi:chromatin segregation and condensation protein Rec8/ScpA/Scc1 (kleisin family)